MAGSTRSEIASQFGRTAVVTGATGGLGYETALALAKAGAEVVLTGRDDQKGRSAVEKISRETTGARVSYEHLDLASLASVADFAQRMHARQSLDLLINNAGVMALPHRHLPAMFSLLDRVSWPSDFGVFELGSVLIRESTHSFSPFSVHRSMVGRRRSLVRSALGKAILAASPPASRREMLDLTASLVEEDAGLAKDRRFIEDILLQTKKDGYASSVGGPEAGISAIALAIPGGGPVLGSLNLIFFSSSMTPEAAARKYLPNMKVAVKEIERRWSIANKARGKVA